MKSFYVFQRGTRKNYYVQFVDPITGRLKAALSTGKTTYEEALQQAYIMLQTSPQVKKQLNIADCLQNALLHQSISQDDILRIQSMFGIAPTQLQPLQNIAPISTKNKTPLLRWLKDFWTYETSEYVQDRLSHGMRIGERYCYEQKNTVKYWEEFFTDKTTLEDLTGNDLQNFEKYLWEKDIQKRKTIVDETTGKKSIEVYSTKLSTTTRNNIMKCASIAFEWATNKKILAENPCKALTAYSIKAKKRDILNRNEASALFTTGKWKDERARVASLVAMTTGLRISEVLALTVDSIGEDRLYISHSFSHKDGLTCTKNGESRIVPLVPKVKSELEKLYWSNPHKELGDKFIFFGNLPHKPVVQNVITDGLKFAMESIGINETQRQERNIVFHSWRHFYATTIATELSEKHAQLTLGHLTQAMTKHYADHKTEEALMTVCDASNEIFKQMIG